MSNDLFVVNSLDVSPAKWDSFFAVHLFGKFNNGEILQNCFLA